jgi:hypothetical protein
MSIENKCCEFYRRRDWQSLHCVLDSASPGRDADERYWALVVDAKYLLAHLLASNGLEVEKAVLDDIPEGYIHITDRGQRISKSDLADLIRRRLK